VAVKSRFTRIPKVHDLVMAGVPTEVIPTYCALTDYSKNKTGLCWPRMETLARRLSRSPRTIQRHLHLLRERGLIEFVKRKRDARGRFGAYLYRVLHIVAATTKGEAARTGRRSQGRGSKKRPTTGHEGRMASIKRQTKRQEDSPLPPKEDTKTGYSWLFGEQMSSKDNQEQHEMREKRLEDARRRQRGYEWCFE
jgi:DNA-binding transcriptional ArsR family regulator